MPGVRSTFFLDYPDCFSFILTVIPLYFKLKCGMWVLNKTNNLQKPNPLPYLPYKGMGILKPLSLCGRGLERG
jgi:hypothetical protein